MLLDAVRAKKPGTSTKPARIITSDPSGFVGRLPTKEVADEQSAAEEHQQPRDGARLKPGNFRKREGYVRERAEHAAKAQNRHQDGKPDCRI